jgi:hypothetical protein
MTTEAFMVSGRLIRLVESHQQEITDDIIHVIRHHPELVHMRNLTELELRARARHISERLGHWLAAGKEEELAKEYEAIGKTRFEESIPLHESVRTLCIIKDKMISFVQEHAINKDSMELYAEEELECRVSRFFDVLVIHLVRGYESAWRIAAHAAA